MYVCLRVCLAGCVFMSVTVLNPVFICLPPQQLIYTTIYTHHEIEMAGISLQPIATTGQNFCNFPARWLGVGDSDYICARVCVCVRVCMILCVCVCSLLVMER